MLLPLPLQKSLRTDFKIGTVCCVNLRTFYKLYLVGTDYNTNVSIAYLEQQLLFYCNKCIIPMLNSQSFPLVKLAVVS